jgi:hypothetical protein
MTDLRSAVRTRLSPAPALLPALALSMFGWLACGRTAAHPGGRDAGTGGGAAAATGGTTAGSGGTVVVPGSGGAAGSAGGPSGSGGDAAGGRGGAGGLSGIAPAVNVSGRWGLFVFEDPVGVLLVQAADGTLTGEGCAAGAPGSTGPREPGVPLMCGAIFGRVEGRSAWFGFRIEDFFFQYLTRVIVSDDAQRMGGGLSTVTADTWYPVAWRRVRADAVWLDRGKVSRPEPMAGRYDLTLIPEESLGSEFAAGTTYQLRYHDHTIAGDLGSFWTDELSPLSEGSPLRVGPVSATSPTLPTSLTLDFDTTGFTGVTAGTPSGGRYRFAVRPTAP